MELDIHVKGGGSSAADNVAAYVEYCRVLKSAGLDGSITHLNDRDYEQLRIKQGLPREYVPPKMLTEEEQLAIYEKNYQERNNGSRKCSSFGTVSLNMPPIVLRDGIGTVNSDNNIKELEDKLKSSELSQAKRYAVKKKLAILKANRERALRAHQ